MSLLKTCNGGDVAPTIDLTDGLQEHYLLNNNEDDIAGTHNSIVNNVDFHGDKCTYAAVDTPSLTTGINNTTFKSMSFWVFMKRSITTQADGGMAQFGNSNYQSRFCVLVSSYVNIAPYKAYVMWRWRLGSTSGIWNYQFFQADIGLTAEGRWVHVYLERVQDTRYDKVFFDGVEATEHGTEYYSGYDDKDFANEIDLGYYTENTSNAYRDNNHGVSNLRFYNDSKDQEFITALFEEGYYPKPLPLPTTTGLVAHYPLTGTAEDSTGNYDGVESGNTYVDDVGFGSVANFDGVNDYIDIDNTLFGITSAFTMSCWVKRTDLVNDGRNHTLYAHGISGATANSAVVGKGFVNFTDGKFNFWVTKDSTDGRGRLLHNTSIDDLDWHLVTVTWDGTTNNDSMKLYLDGILDSGAVAEAPNFTTFDTASEPCAIGRDAYRNDFFSNLSKSDMRFYTRPLAQQEITDLYNYEKNFRPIDIDDGLVAYYPLANNSLDNYYNEYDGADTSMTYDGSSGVFNGTTSYTYLPKTIDMEHKSIGMWIKSNNSTHFGRCFFAYDGDADINNRFYINVNNGSLEIVLGSEGVAAVIQALTANTYYHVVVSKTSTTTADIYVDGIYKTTLTFTAFNSLDATNFGIGATNIGTNPLDGNIAKIRIYNKDITAEQVEIIYNTEKGDFI